MYLDWGVWSVGTSFLSCVRTECAFTSKKSG